MAIFYFRASNPRHACTRLLPATKIRGISSRQTQDVDLSLEQDKILPPS